MKKFITLMIATAFLLGCSEKNEPQNTVTKEKSVNFTYKQTKPFTIEFINKSNNISKYSWDFGDGNVSSNVNPTHVYENTGTYTVTLTGDNKYEYQAKISIEKPQIYVAGWKIYKIPYQNKYYKLGMYDEKSKSGFVTGYTKSLTDSDLPLTRNFGEPRQIEELSGSNFYIFELYCSDNTSSDGSSCYKGKLRIEDMNLYYPEYTWSSTDGKTKIGVLMEYK